MSTKSSSPFPILLLVWLLAMLGITFGIAQLAWGLSGQGEKFWLNLGAVVAMQVFIGASWLFMGWRKQSRMIAVDFGFAGIAGLYLLATFAIVLIGLLDVSINTLGVLHLLAAAGFITLALIFALGRSAAKSSWEGMDAREQPLEKMRADLRRIADKMPAAASPAVQAEWAQVLDALKYATSESFPGAEAQDAVLATRLAELNGAVEGLPGGSDPFFAAGRRLKQAVEERETVMKELRPRA